jgi:hypothetical protein
VTDAEDRAFLSSRSQHPERPYDVSEMHPRLVSGLAAAMRDAIGQGIPVQLLSGTRRESDHPSAYDLSGKSSHLYGGAGDVTGIGAAGSPTAQKWYNIATSHGVYNPYGYQHPSEFNHFQLTPQPLETTPQLLASLTQARKTGNIQNVWNAYSQQGGMPQGNMTGMALTATPNAGGASGADNRVAVFQMLRGLGLTPQQALGAMWSLGGESYHSLSANAYNPNDPGGAYGIGQWTGPRRAALNDLAQKMGQPPGQAPNAAAQIAFMRSELTTGDKKGVLELLKQAPDAPSASRIWTTKYEVPHNAAAVAEERIKNGAKVGSVDASGNFVMGAPAPAGAATPAPAAGGTAAAPSTTPASGTPSSTTPTVVPMQPSPWSGFGAALAGAPSMGGGSGSSIVTDTSQDARPVTLPMPAPSNAPNALPLEYQQGHPGLGAQLGQLASQPIGEAAIGGMPPPDSITAGAPGMTQLLGAIGTSSDFNYLDPRAVKPVPTTMKMPRLA